MLSGEGQASAVFAACHRPGSCRSARLRLNSSACLACEACRGNVVALRIGARVVATGADRGGLVTIQLPSRESLWAPTSCDAGVLLTRAVRRTAWNAPAPDPTMAAVASMCSAERFS
eukprot:419916-Rhodomonas_salina.2